MIAENSSPINHPMRPLCQAWLRLIERALKYKKTNFQKVADECKRFLDGGTKLNEYMWGAEGKDEGGYLTASNENDVSPPAFQFTTNKVAELTQLFAPTLYNRNPVRTVTPRKYDPIPPGIYAALNPQIYQMATAQLPQVPPGATPEMLQQVFGAQQQQEQAIMQLDSMIQQGQQEDMMTQVVDQTTAQLVEEVLNYTPNELDLEMHSRLVIDETIVKGMGIWWTELYDVGGAKLFGSFYDTVDNLLLDPDVELIDDCKWAARRCRHPQWEVEEHYDLAPGALDAAAKGIAPEASSNASYSTNDNRGDAERQRRGETAPIVTYWKIYSKMGMGGRLGGIDPKLKNIFDGFGDNCMLVVCEGIPYPLNLPTERLNEAPQEVDPEGSQQWVEGIQQSTSWPIPFWKMPSGWPFTPLIFHFKPNSLYPYSHVAPGLGELKWLNWCMSFLAGKVKSSCTTIVAIPKAMAEDDKKKVIGGSDQRVVEIDMTMYPNLKPGDVVSYIQQPEFHADLYKVKEAVEESLDKRWGVTELLQGETGNAQSRSATDVSVRQSNSSIRLDDMAKQTQKAMSILARKEALAWRTLGDANDVRPILGEARAQLWAQLVQSADVQKIVQELEYRIESGSMAKPNTETRLQNMTNMAQHLLPVLQQALMMGNVGPFNAFMEDWGKASGLDVAKYMLQPPPPVSPPQQAPEQKRGEKSPEQQQAPPPNQHGMPGREPRQAA